MFFGWYVVAGTFVAQMLIVGFFTYSVSLLVGPVCAEFDVNLEQVMYSMTIGTLVGLAAAPVAGALLDRYSVRSIISGGVIVFALGLYWAANAGSITEYVIVFGLVYAISNAMGGSMAASTTVSRWFSTSRGKALGIAAIGTSAGGLVVPALISYWVETSGWRSALENMALAAIVLVLPFVVATIRGKPEDIGLEIEGGNAAQAQAGTASTALSVGDILRTPAYWYIGLSLGLLFCVYSAVLANLAPYAADLGHDSGASSRLIMVLAIASFVGKIVFGVLADKINLKVGLWIAIALVALTLLILITLPSYTMLMLAAALMGLATGGMLPVWGSMMAQAFGLISYGKAMGLMGPIITVLVMPGFTVMGRLYDASGSYQLGMTVFAGVTVVSALALIPLKLEKPQ